MRSTRVCIVLSICIFALAAMASAQTRKAGLWEMNTNMTWQQSPFPGGNAPGGGAHTTEVCVTQEYLDKYGAIIPQSHGNCVVSNLVKTDHGMTADYACTG
jgi:hypothetical protein